MLVSHMDIHQKKMEAGIEAERKVDQEEMLARVDAIQEKLDANHEDIMAEQRPWQKEMKANPEPRKAMDLEANPGEKESGAVHEEVPKEHAAVKPVGGLRKWHRGQHLAAGRHGQPEEGTWGNYGFWKKLVAARGRMTRHAGVAQHKGHRLQGQSKDDVLPRTSKRRTLGRRYQQKLECKNGIRNRGLRQELQSKKEFNKTLRETLELEIVKRAMSSRLRKIKNWTLWRGRAPSEMEKEIAWSRSWKCGSTGHLGWLPPPLQKKNLG
jgi:hypothetical protein